MARVFKSLDRMAVILAIAALLFLMSLITVSVFGRYFLNQPVPDDLVISEITLVFVAFLPLARVQALRDHIFVTVFTDWLPLQQQKWLERFGDLFGAVVISIITYAVFLDFYSAYDSGSYFDGVLRIPEWPGRLIVALGLAALALRLVFDGLIGRSGTETPFP